MLNNDYLANKNIIRAIEEWAIDVVSCCFDQDSYIIQYKMCCDMAEMNKYCKVDNNTFKYKIEKLANMYRQ